MTKPALLMVDSPHADSEAAADTCTMEVFVDLTTIAHATGKSAGSTRVEWQMAQHVAAQEAAAEAAGRPRAAMRYVAWSGVDAAFVEMSPTSMATLRDECMAAAGAPRGTQLDDEAIALEPGQRRVLLVTGAGWLSNAQYQHDLRAFRSRLRAELHVVIHDVTHLMFPHWFSDADAQRIGSNMIAMIATADALLVYSDSTARDIETITARLGVTCPPVRRIALGSDLPATGPIAPLEDLPYAELLGDRPFALYVSTITFRKNHDFIYQVWRKLAIELGDALPRLLLIGRVSPEMNVVADRIRRDPAVSDHISILTNVSDDHLASLYTHCAFTVYPSLYEGWGLPVAESLQYGKVCVTSNAASLPESSGGVTPLLDPFDHAAWCAEIRRLSLQPATRARIESRIRKHRPISWAKAAELVRTAIALPAPPHDAFGQIDDLDKSDKSDNSDNSVNSDSNEMRFRIVATEGFTPGERAGTLLASGDRARVGLLLEDVPPPGIRVWTTVEPLITCPSNVQVSIGGCLSDAVPLDIEGPRVPRTVSAWRGLLNQRGLIDLDFRVVPPRTAGAARREPSPFVLSNLRIERLDTEEAAMIEGHQHLRWGAGDIATFTPGSKRLKFLKSGWTRPAPWGVWSDGPEAELEFLPMPLGGRTFYLRALFRAFVFPEAPTLDVEVFADGVQIDAWRFEHDPENQRTERTLTIPGSDTPTRPINLTFRIPDCRSPQSLGLNDDERMLGIGLVRAQWLFGLPEGEDPHWGGGARY